MHSSKKGKESLSWPNIYCKCPCVMEADGTSWPDYKLGEKRFWNINVAWIYWGSVALHLSLMASPSCCLPDCGPLKWTDLGHAVFARLSGVCILVEECLSDGVSVCVGLQDTVNQLYISDWLADCRWLSGIMSISVSVLWIVPSG